MQEQFFYPRLVKNPKDKDQNVIRILNERPIQFSEVFIVKKDEKGVAMKKEDGKPKITPYRKLICDGQIDVNLIELAEKTDKPRDIDAYLVFNNHENRLQIWCIAQHKIRKALKDLSVEAALSGKKITDFDLTIVKSGDGTKNNTEYSIEVDRNNRKLVFSKLDKQVEEFYTYCKPFIKGYALVAGEYPLQGDAAEPMPKDVKKIFALLKSGKITVDTLRKETDIVVAKMLFRELAKQAAENTDHPGYLIDGDVLMSLDEIKQIRDEIITPF